MTKTELIETMRRERARWEELLAQVGPDSMTGPVLDNGWSVKDTIGHVTFYEHWLLDWLEAAVRGKVTAASHRDVFDVDQRNALIFEDNKDRPLEEVEQESRDVFERLLEVVQTLPERDLLERERFSRYIAQFWPENPPLWECIAGNSYEHYREHSPSIEAWLQKRQVAVSSS